MSYVIEYARQFLKTGLGYVPCWLSGDNNVTEPHWVGGRYVERRSRDWCVFLNLLGVTEDELMDKLRSMCGGPYQEHWKRGGKYLDDAAILRWGKSGCKQAAYIEDVLLANRLNSVQCCISVWTKDMENSIQLSDYVSSTEELETWIDKVRQYKERHTEVQVYPIIRFPVDGFSRPTTGSGRACDQVVLKSSGKSYVIEIEERDGHIRGISHSPDPKRALVMDRAEAERIIRSAPGFKLKIGSAKIVSKPNNVIIRFGAGKLDGYYYYGPSKNGFRYTPSAASAKRFADESAAKRTMARLESYNPEITTV